MDFCGGGVEVCESHPPEQGYAHRSQNVSSNEGYSSVVGAGVWRTGKLSGPAGLCK